tara:strand:+ start:2794 stop:3228 length:435 start_codon:yes stop_codon:yes gene_type:complete
MAKKSGTVNSSGFNGFYENLAKQGKQFEVLISSSNQYFAYLSKVEQNYKTKLYDIYFELFTKEWGDNTLMSGSIDVQMSSPVPPVSAFHMRNKKASDLLAILGLKSQDNLAEGSWYLIELIRGSTGTLDGDFYNPDIDHLPYIK